MKDLAFRFCKIAFVVIFSLLLRGDVINPIDPRENAVWHNDRGIDYLRKGFYYGAVQEFKLAILLNDNSPSSGVFYNNLGETYMKLGQYSWAVDCFEQSLKYNPNFIYYYENYAKALNKSNRLNSQILKYKNLSSTSPKVSSNWLMLGIFYKEKGNKKQAVECFDRFLELEPKIILSPSIRRIRDDLK